MKSAVSLRFVVSVILALAAPFPSKVRYAPVARGFWALLTEEGGDYAAGMGYVLFGSCFYLMLYSAIIYGLLTLGERLSRRFGKAS